MYHMLIIIRKLIQKKKVQQPEIYRVPRNYC